MKQNTVRFAVIGTAGIGIHHIEGIHETADAELTAVCDIIPEYAAACAAQNNLTCYYTDYNEMLADGGFDCVIICTPDYVHKEQAIAALEHGYHVLCEKPLAMTLEDCGEIVAAAKKSDRKFMVGQVCRKAPAFRLAKQMADRGEIGKLFFIESEYAHDYSLVPDRGGWRHDPVKLRYPVVGGGCHAMDLLRWIAGDPVEVFAYANHEVLTDWPVDDCTISVLKYPRNVIGKVFTSIGCKRPYTMRTVLYGTEGTIITDNTSPELTLYKKFFFEDTKKTQYLPTIIPVAVNSHNMASEIDDICHAIRNDADIETDAVEGANTVVVCQAAVESARTGKPVTPKYFK